MTSAHSQAVRVITIGAGYFARFHVEAWLRSGRAHFVGLADLDVTKAQALLADFGSSDVAVRDDTQALLGRLKPDIVDIAVPPAAHLALIKQALASAAHTIICQKPFCTSIDEARMAVDCVREAGKLLVVHENFRFQPWYRVIRKEITSGRLGDVYQITFRLRTGDGRGADAYLARQPYFRTMARFLIHETGIHYIDVFRFLMGEPDAVIADLRRLNPAVSGEDSGFFILRFPDGRRALFDGNRLVDNAADDPRLTLGECLVEGERGVLTLDGFGLLHFRPVGSKHWQDLDADYPRTSFGGDCIYALQEHVIDHVLSGTPVENDAAAYLRNMEIEQAIYASAESGQIHPLPTLGRS